GPDDEIMIRAMDAEEISDKPFTIDSSGLLNLPMLGRVQAAGLTVVQLESALMTRLKEFVWDAHVAVTVTQYLSKPVSVIGEVKKAGGFPLNEREDLSVLQAVSLAEGLQPTAAPAGVQILRSRQAGGRKEIAVDLKRILSGKMPDVKLQPDDILFVPGSTGKK